MNLARGPAKSYKVQYLHNRSSRYKAKSNVLCIITATHMSTLCLFNSFYIKSLIVFSSSSSLLITIKKEAVFSNNNSQNISFFTRLVMDFLKIAAAFLIFPYIRMYTWTTKHWVKCKCMYASFWSRVLLLAILQNGWLRWFFHDYADCSFITQSLLSHTHTMPQVHWNTECFMFALLHIYT